MDKQTIYFTQETLRQAANMLNDGNIVYAAAVIKNTFVTFCDTESFFESLAQYSTPTELDDLKGLVRTLFGG